MISVRDKISHVLTARARVRGVGIEFLLQSCCCWCYVIQHVNHVLRIEFLLQSCCCWCYVIQHAHHVLHECVVGCPIISSTYEQVPINQHSVGIDFNCNHVVVGASSSSLCIIHCMNVLLHVQFYQACMNHVVVSDTSSNLCIMCCTNVL